MPQTPREDSQDPPHRPVLLKQVNAFLDPRKGQTFLDLTVGYGGHAEAILTAVGNEGQLIGIDTDKLAVQAATERLKPFGAAFIAAHANFIDAPRVLSDAGVEQVDGILIDLGVSSPQLGSPDRGFSFSADGPLDMRMDASDNSPTAEQLVNRLPEEELANLIFINGEERYSRRIARAIVRQRQKEPILTTAELASVVKWAYPKRRFRTHPATKTFQALRIAVNHELDSLRTVLELAVNLLAPGGRLAVISFHSLEDRIVKRFIRDEAAAGLLSRVTRKPVIADPDEIEQNPRARSAKLRVAQKEAA